VSGTSSEDRGGASTRHHINVPLGEFAWQEVERESEELGVSVEELIAFATLYYLADRDSGRIARRPPRGRFPGPA
jgi:hypothetical protein